MLSPTPHFSLPSFIHSIIEKMAQTIRGYTLTHWLGAGGMGEVYRALHIPTQRTVAVKLLSRAELSGRFRNEAAVQASVRHPHIALLYEFFVENGLSCLVMEFVEGPTLQQHLRRTGPLPEDAAFRLLGQLASALTYLHERGIVHRDLKAGNVKITPSGNVKILDFGLARAGDSPKLTSEGHVVGTASSMAPEQFTGEATPASDCWALGVLLYHMLTGYPPFGGATDSEIGRLIQKADFLPPTRLRPDLSPFAQRLIERLLTVAPDRRLTARQVQEALRDPGLLDAPAWVGQVRAWWKKLGA